jgi:YVTN family beta-propeller protein
MNLIKIILPVLLILLASCKKEKVNEPQQGEDTNYLINGYLVLNEGLFQHNNARLSWVDLASDNVNSYFFEEKSGRPLGDTGNDIGRYGAKIYVVVNVSNTIEVLSARTGKAVKQISMMANNQGKQPREMAFINGKVFISCFDGYVDVLDTSSLSITQRIKVGSNPDQIIVCGGKVFVSNSGGLNFPDLDSTVSVIDPATNMETSKITVGLNPGGLKAWKDQYVLVNTRGNFDDVSSNLIQVNAGDELLSKDYGLEIGGMEIKGDELFVFQSNPLTINVFDLNQESFVQNDFINLSKVETAYGLQYIAKKEEFVVFDAQQYTNTGKMLIYDSKGAFKKEYSLGLIPKKCLVYE